MKTKHFIYFVLAAFLFLGCSNDESGNGEGGANSMHQNFLYVKL